MIYYRAFDWPWNLTSWELYQKFFEWFTGDLDFICKCLAVLLGIHLLGKFMVLLDGGFLKSGEYKEV